MSDRIAPTKFTYERWRHGGWYVNEVRYPSGAIGCVSNNYEDGKWRIACDERPFEEQPTFKTGEEAALAEWHLAESLRAVPEIKPDARRLRIRHCTGDTAAWLLVTLRADGSELDSYGSYTTAMSLDGLLARPGHLTPRPGDVVELLP